MLKNCENGSLAEVTGIVESVAEQYTKKNKSFVVVTLCNNGETCRCIKWNQSKSECQVKPKDIVKISGSVNVYEDSVSLIINKIEKVEKPSQELLMKLLPTLSQEDTDYYIGLMRQIMGDIKNKQYLEFLSEIFKKYKEKFLKAPAAKKNHDAFIGGLLKHTVNVTKIALTIAEFYGQSVDRDLIATGALVHDLGKICTYNVDVNLIDLSNEGHLLDHVFSTLSMIDEIVPHVSLSQEQVLMIKHIIVSHHGLKEWGAINQPAFPEASIIHYADMIDSQVCMMQDALANTTPGNITEDKIYPFGYHLYRKSDG